VPFAFASGYGEAGLSEGHRGALVLQKPFREADLRRVLEGTGRPEDRKIPGIRQLAHELGADRFYRGAVLL
jgi:hypothetical protein